MAISEAHGIPRWFHHILYQSIMLSLLKDICRTGTCFTPWGSMCVNRRRFLYLYVYNRRRRWRLALDKQKHL